MCCYGVLRVRDTARPRISAVIAAGVHLFPFRTEKLSPLAPMVLGEQSPGRVGSRRSLSRAVRAALSFWSGLVSGGSEALAPAGIELSKALDALGDRRVRSEERRKALLRERVDRVERLGGRARAEVDQLARLLQSDERVGQAVWRPAECGRGAVGRELSFRRQHEVDERRRDRAEDDE